MLGFVIDTNILVPLHKEMLTNWSSLKLYQKNMFNVVNNQLMFQKETCFLSCFDVIDILDRVLCTIISFYQYYTPGEQLAHKRSVTNGTNASELVFGFVFIGLDVTKLLLVWNNCWWSEIEGFSDLEEYACNENQDKRIGYYQDAGSSQTTLITL